MACGAGRVCASGACKLDLGAVCTGGADCASGICVADTGSGTQGRCRSPCTGSCPGGFNCVPLTSTSACLPAPAATSRWRVAVVSARINQVDPSGAAWDAPGGLPDVKVCLSIGGASAGCTVEASDTLTASYAFVTTASYTHAELASVTVTVIDVDPVSDDTIEVLSGRSVQSLVEASPWTTRLTGPSALEVVLEARPQ